MNVINAFVEADGDETLAAAIDSESEDYDGAAAVAAVNEFAAAVAPDATADYTLEDEETLATEDVTYTGEELAEAAETFAEYNGEEPDPADYGIWVPGIPVLVGSLLESMNCGGCERRLPRSIYSRKESDASTTWLSPKGKPAPPVPF